MNPIAKAGFTGPRTGMSDLQVTSLQVVWGMLKVEEVHHGCCVGADFAAHELAVSLGLRTVGHPPKARGLRAHCKCTEMREPEAFLARDRHIVQETGVLVATPSGPERLRSGTWTTIRYARRLTQPIIIIDADGRLVPQNLTLPDLST